ncbi:hypothetical protein WJX74_010559 [Apatococcus lobatus]|uniref:Uncharacterized protein n=1 Tax=Apatococcus lobatus TaxID=904363 RepID=A0AAW1QUN0_9CHLO
MTEIKLPRTNERHHKLSESSEREKKKRYKKAKGNDIPSRPAEPSQQNKNPFQQLGDVLVSPLPPDVRADLGATFNNIGAAMNGAREGLWRALTGANRS